MLKICSKNLWKNLWINCHVIVHVTIKPIRWKSVFWKSKIKAIRTITVPKFAISQSEDNSTVLISYEIKSLTWYPRISTVSRQNTNHGETKLAWYAAEAYQKGTIRYNYHTGETQVKVLTSLKSVLIVRPVTCDLLLANCWVIISGLDCTSRSCQIVDLATQANLRNCKIWLNLAFHWYTRPNAPFVQTLHVKRYTLTSAGLIGRPNLEIFVYSGCYLTNWH